MDIVKQLERAKRYIEKNQLDDAIDAYQVVLTSVPNHIESIQALGDLYTRRSQFDRAALYYGALFDRFTTPREEPKALALYTRYLKSHQQPPERVARYALLLQKQNRPDEAIEQFMSAALAFELSDKGGDALACFMRIAELDPDNRDRHVAAGELAERLGNRATAARAYLRAGQLTTQDDAGALDLFSRAHALIPTDRSAALLYAQGLLRGGRPAEAVALLAPLAATEKDAPFIETYAQALMRAGQLDQARVVLGEAPATGSAEKIFELAGEYLRAHRDDHAVDLLGSIKKTLLASRREWEFAAGVDHLVAEFPKSLRLAEAWAAMYAEMNRESKYFDATIALFDLYVEHNEIAGASTSLQKLVDIDPYDPRCQKRLDVLQGRADESFLSRLRLQLMKSATHGSQFAPQSRTEVKNTQAGPVLLEDVRAGQTLEDLLVQAEIFIQYSLTSKAVERLQRIAELFPEEADRNERLQGLFTAAGWSPQPGVPVNASGTEPLPVAEELAARPDIFSPDTLSDLAKITEINQNVFRQPSPRAMMSVAVNEVGTYLHATRCFAVLGPPGQPPQMASEYCAPGIEPSPGWQVVRLVAQLEQAAPDTLGGLPLDAAAASAVAEIGLESVLAVHLTDPETHAPAGLLAVGFNEPHVWKPNQTYFLQSIGDQMLLCVHHTRLRSLLRSLAVADEKTGLLARGSYIDCLLHECQQGRTQGKPLTLALLQVDGGPELLRHQGDAPFENYMEQLGKALQSVVRQTDLAVKYTSWALAFILPDTSLVNGRIIAEKLKKLTGSVRTPWDGTPVTSSVSLAEATLRHGYDNEDIVTDLINRAENGLEEARKRGGNEVVSLETAKA